MKCYRFFKYTDWIVENLRENKIYISDALGFNDFYDSRIRIDSKESNDRFLDAALEYFNKSGLDPYNSYIIICCAKLGFPIHDLEYEGQQVDLPPFTDLFYEIIGRVKEKTEFYHFLKSKIQNDDLILSFLKHVFETGILSFVKENNLPHMWAYYGDNHQGFCLEFEYDSNNINYGVMKDVIYSEKPLPLINGDRLISEEEISLRLITKSVFWSGEMEVRLITPKAKLLVDMPFKITGICFGVNMKAEGIEQLRAIFKESVTYYYILPDHEDFHLRWIEEETCFL